jgi:hypothetical protein
MSSETRRGLSSTREETRSQFFQQKKIATPRLVAGCGNLLTAHLKMRYRGPLRLRLGIMRRAGTIPQPLSVTDIFFVRDALLSVWKGAVADEAASIAVHEINSSKAERLATFAETSEQTVGDGGTPSVLVNHIDEARFVGANFRALFRGYLNGGAVDWSASSDVRAALHPARVLAAPEVCQADAGRSAAGAWHTLNTNVAARRIPDFDARTMTVLERTRGRRQQRRCHT